MASSLQTRWMSAWESDSPAWDYGFGQPQTRVIQGRSWQTWYRNKATGARTGIKDGRREKPENSVDCTADSIWGANVAESARGSRVWPQGPWLKSTMGRGSGSEG
jgi:hypothetical protein